MIEQIVHKTLTTIQAGIQEIKEQIGNEGLNNQISNLNEYFKDSNHYVASIIIFTSFYLAYLIIVNYQTILSVNTYSFFFVRLFKDTWIFRSKLIKERQGLLKFCYEGMDISKNEIKYKLHENGLNFDTLIDLLNEMAKRDKTDVSQLSKQTGCVYRLDKDLDELAGKAAELYAFTDLQFPETVPSAKRIERNLVDIMLKLFNAPPETGCGLSTSGGTESIITSMLAAKNLGLKRNIKVPEVICSLAAHAAFDKAATIFGLKLVRLELNDQYTLDINLVRKNINENTICLVGSAIDFPHGLEDDIKELSDLALKHNLLLHVDACMGGFLSAFHHEFNKNWKPADFLLPGVTCISCDVHKYGLTPKGASIIMFRDKSIQNLINFGMVGTDGLYTTSSFACARPPSFIAASLMVLVHVGKKAYIDQAKRIHNVLTQLKKDFKTNLPRLEILGNPQVSIFAFKGEKCTQIQNEMKKRGWAMNIVNNPIAIAFCITGANVKSFEDGSFMKALKECYTLCYEKNITSQGGLAALYGVAALLPEDVVTSNMDIAINCFLDTKEHVVSLMENKDGK